MNNILELLDKFAADERFVSHRELHQIARGAVGLVEELDRLRADVARLKEALTEACVTRHFVCMEQDLDANGPQDKHLPYRYDSGLIKWTNALGYRVYSAWPHPGQLELDEPGEE